MSALEEPINRLFDRSGRASSLSSRESINRVRKGMDKVRYGYKTSYIFALYSQYHSFLVFL